MELNMTTALINMVSRLFSLSWLTGAIFEKELRVASRRRRSYVLRCSYVLLLTIIFAMVWSGVVEYGGSSLQVSSRMSIAGQAIIAFIIWFQFCSCQIIAGVMLSTSISDEIYHKTLGLLMTTPINSFQIVMGKLLSKLLQLLLLLAISLPLLAIVRIFGGVPWNYVISSLCITFTTVLFVGSLSMFYSIFCRKAYVVIILTILTLAVLFLLLPSLTAWIWYIITDKPPGKVLTAAIFLPNPYITLVFKTRMLIEPRAVGGAPRVFWPIHCGVMLAASFLILLVSIIIVRKVALRQATGQLVISSGKNRNRKKSPIISAANKGDLIATIRAVKGPPVLWKEMRLPILGRHKIINMICIIIGIGLLLLTYLLCARERILDEEEVHMFYSVIFVSLGILLTIVIPATNITTEKESRSWPLLLTTTLNDWDILLGKFFGNIRRLIPVWLLLFGHVIIFSLIGYIHPVAILQIAILVTWIVIFLSCTGIYFSSRFKRTTTAVVMNFLLAATIWALVPLLLFVISDISDSSDDFAESYMDTHPIVNTVVIMEATADKGRLGNYHWVGSGSTDFFESMGWMLVCMLGYLFMGIFFAWRAKSRFRKHIY
jgi:ABC-type transport system involved in multi-copper enzyme maturation permease subunit